MNNFRYLISFTVLLVLFGWVISAYYSASEQIADFVKNPDRKYMFELNIGPFIALVCIGGILAFFIYRKKKRNNKILSKVFLLPAEFEEVDEREKMITARACRTSYVAMMYAGPIITALFIFYPFVAEKVPYYPIILFLLLPFVQYVAYFLSWRKNY
ncbi:hypothetical protein KHA94_19595 [Bacillus sp. FJAT-49705]|uniref:DUF2178 domain-containing protein n=1 Tax=Cytobacillus citreus TaxID=2833586 RepID=A0ABS5NZR4_9BACI|nr:hypothetical protein [Cytobacillus citreus]MBS4192364.1 hypothetical protein [Cytobacillus citreus]